MSPIGLPIDTYLDVAIGLNGTSYSPLAGFSPSTLDKPPEFAGKRLITKQFFEALGHNKVDRSL
jgi:hypothetical protein